MITILVNNMVINCICLYIYITYLQLVGGLEPCNFMTFHILGIVTPTDELIFFTGVETTNQITYPMDPWPLSEKVRLTLQIIVNYTPNTS